MLVHEQHQQQLFLNFLIVQLFPLWCHTWLHFASRAVLVDHTPCLMWCVDCFLKCVLTLADECLLGPLKAECFSETVETDWCVLMLSHKQECNTQCPLWGPGQWSVPATLHWKQPNKPRINSPPLFGRAGKHFKSRIIRILFICLFLEMWDWD